MLLVGIANVGEACVKVDDQKTNDCSPKDGHQVDTNLSRQIVILEGTLGHDHGGRLEGSNAENEKHSERKEENGNLVDNREAEAQQVNNQRDSREAESDDGEGEREPRQEVVCVSVADKLRRHALRCVEVVLRGYWVGWTQGAVAVVTLLTNSPESPFRSCWCSWNVGCVRTEPVKMVQGKMV